MHNQHIMCKFFPSTHLSVQIFPTKHIFVLIWQKALTYMTSCVHSAAMVTKKTAGRGFFLVFEGIDGAGTTSQQRWLCEELERQGMQVHKTAEPTANPVGRLIREVLRGEHAPFSAHALALLFAADRADHLSREIDPAVLAGKVVVSDRYVLSSLAYQTMAGVPDDLVAQANAPFRTPDLTVYFDLPVEVAAQRRAKRGQAQEIFEVDDFQRGVATRYLDHAKRWQREGKPIVFVDAAQSFDAVSRQLYDLVLPHLVGTGDQRSGTID